MPDWLDRTPEETLRDKRIAESKMTLEEKLAAYFAPRAIEAQDFDDGA